MIIPKIKPTHLPKAPITEALIDIRVKNPNGFDISSINTSNNQIDSQYPVKKIQYSKELNFSPESGLQPNNEPTINGYLFISRDKTQIIQNRVDGYTFSRLFPYTNWKDLKKNAKRYWNNYRKLANPEIIHRIAVRYINKFEVTVPFTFEEYLSAPPVLPDNFPTSITSFFSKITFRDVETSADVIVTQTMENDDRANKTTILLDIDVIIKKNIVTNDETMWDKLDDLRNLKNAIFFGSITNKTLELFK